MALKTWEPKRLPVRPGTAADTMRQACPLAQPRQAHRSSVEIERSGDAAAYEFLFVQICSIACGTPHLPVLLLCACGMIIITMSNGGGEPERCLWYLPAAVLRTAYES